MAAGFRPPPPEQAAPPIVATFFVEFLPNVKNEYALLEQASDGPLKISLPDLQMETLIFALHCLDRSIFAHWGPEYRAAFMDYAFGTACELFSDTLPDHAREPFLGWFENRCKVRQSEYGAMTLLPGVDGGLKNVLSWEFGKRICFGAGVDIPEVVLVMAEGANDIFMMMNKIAESLIRHE
jgi:hypothetical protein